jgi:hypothetical protein
VEGVLVGLIVSGGWEHLRTAVSLKRSKPSMSPPFSAPIFPKTVGMGWNMFCMVQLPFALALILGIRASCSSMALVRTRTSFLKVRVMNESLHNHC